MASPGCYQPVANHVSNAYMCGTGGTVLNSLTCLTSGFTTRWLERKFVFEHPRDARSCGIAEVRLGLVSASGIPTVRVLSKVSVVFDATARLIINHLW